MKKRKNERMKEARKQGSKEARKEQLRAICVYRGPVSPKEQRSELWEACTIN
jgi:hypothetical protein